MENLTGGTPPVRPLPCVVPCKLYFTLQYITPETSVAGSIIVKILTFAVSYTLVGIIFNALGWFNSKIMSIAYFVISTLLGFALAYVVMLIETHLLEIGITLGVIFVLSIAAIIFIAIKNKKQDTK